MWLTAEVETAIVSEVNQLKLSLIYIVVAALALAPLNSADLAWNADMHQYVVVKATTLMPSGLQRQILKHRKEILAGCLDVLRDDYRGENGRQEIDTAYRLLVEYLGSQKSFSVICYQMGRLSTLVTEYENPLRTTAQVRGIDAFAAFVWHEIRNLPLIVDPFGEGYLRDKNIGGYLQYAADRNIERSKALLTALSAEPDAGTWRKQRSATYGVATLCYNDMVVDTARLWLAAWEEAGGNIGQAPYFK